MNTKKLIRLYETHQYHRAWRYRMARLLENWVLKRIQQFEKQDRERLSKFMQDNAIPANVKITQVMLEWSFLNMTELHRQPNKDRHFVGDTAKVCGFSIAADGTPLAHLWADGNSFYTSLALITGKE